MIQRQKSHPAGTFLTCRTCHCEPRHIVAGAGTIFTPSGVHYSKETHSLECRCQHRTQKYREQYEAEREWNERFAVTVESAGVSPIVRRVAK